MIGVGFTTAFFVSLVKSRNYKWTRSLWNNRFNVLDRCFLLPKNEKMLNKDISNVNTGIEESDWALSRAVGRLTGGNNKWKKLEGEDTVTKQEQFNDPNNKNEYVYFTDDQDNMYWKGQILNYVGQVEKGTLQPLGEGTLNVYCPNDEMNSIGYQIYSKNWGQDKNKGGICIKDNDMRISGVYPDDKPENLLRLVFDGTGTFDFSTPDFIKDQREVRKLNEGKLYSFIPEFEDEDHEVYYEGKFNKDSRVSSKDAKIYRRFKLSTTEEPTLIFTGKIDNNELVDGVLNLTNGDKYEGEFLNSAYKNGKYSFNGKNRYYEGNFTDNHPNGEGKIYENGEEVYSGLFHMNKKDTTQIEDKGEGEGTYKFSNGNTYTGGWKSDNYNGNGTYKFKSGDFITGIFENGKLIKVSEKSDGLSNSAINNFTENLEIYNIFKRLPKLGKSGELTLKEIKK